MEFVVRKFIDGVIQLKHDEDTATHPTVDVAGGHVRPPNSIDNFFDQGQGQGQFVAKH